MTHGFSSSRPSRSVTCAQCHATQYAFWKQTKHAHAFETLEKNGRQLDLDCIRCHVTGWMEPGGLCNIAKPGDSKDVQCESCHGPAERHAQEPGDKTRITRDMPESGCKSCHTPENSTAFEYASYRKKIVGPGHGR